MVLHVLNHIYTGSISTIVDVQGYEVVEVDMYIYTV
jgi:hypothetical protein